MLIMQQIFSVSVIPQVVGAIVSLVDSSTQDCDWGPVLRCLVVTSFEDVESDCREGGEESQLHIHAIGGVDLSSHIPTGSHAMALNIARRWKGVVAAIFFPSSAYPSSTSLFVSRTLLSLHRRRRGQRTRSSRD